MSLRKLMGNDLARVLVWRNSPEIRRFMFHSHEISEKEHNDWFANIERDSQSFWYIYEDKDGIPSGVVYFTQHQPENRSSFWGFYVSPTSPAGTGTKLGLSALDEAFNILGLHKLNSEVLSFNKHSLHFHEKLGFTQEGICRDGHKRGESFIDIVQLGILKSEWLEKRPDIKCRIAKLDDIAEMKSQIKGGGYKIMLLSDQDSWINPWLGDLAEEWSLAGHECFIAHKIDDAVPADFCFCLSFGQLVSPDVRKQYKHTLVVHESDLPKGRGWSPMSWQIIEGENHIPITLLEAEDKVDSGVIYSQKWIELQGNELSPKWRKLQAEATLQLCQDFISDYPESIKKAQTQKGEPTFYSRRSMKDSQLDPSKTLSEQFNVLRVVDNDQYPAFFECKGETFILKIEAKETGVNTKNE